MRVGFTGTREGCTPAQGGALARYVRDNAATEFHHGACRGADAEAVTHFKAHHPNARVVAYPCDLNMTHRGALAASTESRPEKPPLERNRDIVNAADVLFACPKGPEERRSGTWSTIRYARRCLKPVVIFWPDGTITEERTGATS